MVELDLRLLQRARGAQLHRTGEAGDWELRTNKNNEVNSQRVLILEVGFFFENYSYTLQNYKN